MRRATLVPRSVAITRAQAARVRALFGEQPVLSGLVRRGLDKVLDEEEAARQRAENMLHNTPEGKP